MYLYCMQIRNDPELNDIVVIIYQKKMYISYFLCLFIHQGTLRLFPCLGYCE